MYCREDIGARGFVSHEKACARDYEAQAELTHKELLIDSTPSQLEGEGFVTSCVSGAEIAVRRGIWNGFTK